MHCSRLSKKITEFYREEGRKPAPSPKVIVVDKPRQVDYSKQIDRIIDSASAGFRRSTPRRGDYSKQIDRLIDLASAGFRRLTPPRVGLGGHIDNGDAGQRAGRSQIIRDSLEIRQIEIAQIKEELGDLERQIKNLRRYRNLRNRNDTLKVSKANDQRELLIWRYAFLTNRLYTYQGKPAFQ